VNLAVTGDLAAVFPRFLDQLGLTFIFERTLAQRLFNPCIKNARVNAEHFAQNTDGMQQYAVAFFRMSRSSVTRSSSFLRRRTSASWSVCILVRPLCGSCVAETPRTTSDRYGPIAVISNLGGSGKSRCDLCMCGNENQPRFAPVTLGWQLTYAGRKSLCCNPALGAQS